VWIGIIIVVLQQKNTSHKAIIVMVSTLLILVFSVASISIVDKYTKVASLHNLRSKRLLSLEKTVYSGIVKNDGRYTIGKVTFEIKLVNNVHTSGKTAKLSNKPKVPKSQTFIREFIVAKNLKPGKAKAFRIYINYPTYFKYASYSTKLYLH
jgi:hypothetical protein